MYQAESTKPLQDMSDEQRFVFDDEVKTNCEMITSGIIECIEVLEGEKRKYYITKNVELYVGTVLNCDDYGGTKLSLSKHSSAYLYPNELPYRSRSRSLVRYFLRCARCSNAQMPDGHNSHIRYI
ncbi:hypothetical protein RF11_00497 [Thelohanellus kitauei]|uniref:Uncharacterized protein n=1 Tax=Thelohanellus kitauei TaxID=669202 RepID=A0A0C2MMZ0_THEKT|nr:hypothetical protein RF11_00497 [Thelohanellus kitauei]